MGAGVRGRRAGTGSGRVIEGAGGLRARVAGGQGLFGGIGRSEHLSGPAQGATVRIEAVDVDVGFCHERFSSEPKSPEHV